MTKLHAHPYCAFLLLLCLGWLLLDALGTASQAILNRKVPPRRRVAVYPLTVRGFVLTAGSLVYSLWFFFVL